MNYKLIFIIITTLLLSCFDSNFTTEHINIPSENGMIHKLHYSGFTKDTVSMIGQRFLKIAIFDESKPISVQIQRDNGTITVQLPLEKAHWDFENSKAYYSSVKYDLQRYFKQDIALILFDKGFIGNETMTFTADSSSKYQWMIDPTREQSKEEIRDRLLSQLTMFRNIYENAQACGYESIYWHNIPANLRYAVNGIGVRNYRLTSDRTKRNYYNDDEFNFALKILSKSFSGISWPKQDDIFDSYIIVLKKLEANLSKVNLDNVYLSGK